MGHSVGAHGMIATQGAEPVDAMVMIASHAGITRLISTAAERAKIWAVFKVVMPIASRLLGYVPIEALGMGKSVPVGVMEQWVRWTRRSRHKKRTDRPHGILSVRESGAVARNRRLARGAGELGA